MPLLPEPLAAALAERYTLDRELGRGATAVVYLAHDKKHDRKVALKVLQPELSLAVRAERFLREIQIAAKLTHAHILPLYDSGQVEQFLYYVMPYVPGESLRDRLNREKQLPVEDALRIIREVAAALDYAHRQGVVHRDIKPENILLSEGEAVVADFGIARALTVAGGQTVTEAGVAVGTPAYMSPEQSGGGEPDARADIYSLGCVLYEMLAGHPPFTGATAQEILARHALDPLPSVRSARPDVGEALEAVVAQALAKVPAARFPSAAQFASALVTPRTRVRPRRPALIYAGLALVGVLAAAGAWVFRMRAHSPPAEQSVAVLAFVNMSGDSATEYFSDGVTETLTSGLVQVEGLRVPARTSAFVFKGTKTDIREIGRQLQVAHVVEGSVQRAGNRLRITAQLIKVSDGYHVWSQTFDREAKDVFAVQDEIARRIVNALQVRLAAAATNPLVRRQTKDLEAYDLYLKGRHFYNLPPDGLKQAIPYFEAAIGKDSGYALAYSGLGDAYVLLGQAGYAPRPEVYPKGKVAALRAVEFDSTLAESHTSLAYAEMFVDFDWASAERSCRRAIALNPKYAEAHTRLGQLLGLLGRYDEAIREGKTAVGLDPLSVSNHTHLGQTYYLSGRDDDAISELRTVLALQPDDPRAHSNLGAVYLHKGQLETALAEFQTALRLQPGRAITLARLAVLHIRMGKREEALTILDDLRSRPQRLLNNEAMVYAHLGQIDLAVALFEKGVGPLTIAPFVLVDPIFEPIRSNPGYIAVLRKSGLRQ